MKACEAVCPKCGSDNIARTYREKGEVFSIGYNEKLRKNEFIDEDFPYQKAKQEHIRNHCRCCGYTWESQTEDKTMKDSLLRQSLNP